jgi:hypothetical protein
MRSLSWLAHTEFWTLWLCGMIVSLSLSLKTWAVHTCIRARAMPLHRPAILESSLSRTIPKGRCRYGGKGTLDTPKMRTPPFQHERREASCHLGAFLPQVTGGAPGETSAAQDSRADNPCHSPTPNCARTSILGHIFLVFCVLFAVLHLPTVGRRLGRGGSVR